MMETQTLTPPDMEMQAADAPANVTLNPIEISLLQAQIIEAIRTVYDPEIPVNIYEMGLIYEVNVAPDGYVEIRMTLTSPACPAAQSLPAEVEQKVADVPGVTDVMINVVWDPPYSVDMMSDEAKLELGIY
jgi:FeS assembly SUF system protein